MGNKLRHIIQKNLEFFHLNITMQEIENVIDSV